MNSLDNIDENDEEIIPKKYFKSNNSNSGGGVKEKVYSSSKYDMKNYKIIDSC